MLVVVLSGLLLVLVCGPRDAHAEDDSLPTLVDATAEDIHQVVAQSDADAVLVNVWATWCVPCVEEFPMLVKLQRHYGRDKLEVVFVSTDFSDARTAVREFLKQQGVDFTTYFKVGSDDEFINGLYEGWNGALPATLIYDADKELKQYVDGSVTYEELRGHLDPLINGSERQPEETDDPNPKESTKESP